MTSAPTDVRNRNHYSPVSIRSGLLVLYILVISACIAILQLCVSLGIDFKPASGLHSETTDRRDIERHVFAQYTSQSSSTVGPSRKSTVLTEGTGLSLAGIAPPPVRLLVRRHSENSSLPISSTSPLYVNSTMATIQLYTSTLSSVPVSTIDDQGTIVISAAASNLLDITNSALNILPASKSLGQAFSVPSLTTKATTTTTIVITTPVAERPLATDQISSYPGTQMQTDAITVSSSPTTSTLGGSSTLVPLFANGKNFISIRKTTVPGNTPCTKFCFHNLFVPASEMLDIIHESLISAHLSNLAMQSATQSTSTFGHEASQAVPANLNFDFNQIFGASTSTFPSQTHAHELSSTPKSYAEPVHSVDLPPASPTNDLFRSIMDILDGEEETDFSKSHYPTSNFVIYQLIASVRSSDTAVATDKSLLSESYSVTVPVIGHEVGNPASTGTPNDVPYLKFTITSMVETTIQASSVSPSSMAVGGIAGAAGGDTGNRGIGGEQAGGDVVPRPSSSPMSRTSASASGSLTTIRPTPSTFVVLRDAGPMTRGQYFAVRFIPKVLAILMQTIWSVSHAGIKLIEPFYQMAATEAVHARRTLLADYISSDLSWQSLIDMCRGQWALLFSNLVALALFVIITVVDEALVIRPTAFCETEISTHQPCYPAIYADTTIVYVVQAALALMFVSIVALVLLNHRRHSGIYSDPSKLASLIELLGEPILQQSLLSCASDADNQQISKLFRSGKYHLGLYNNCQGQPQYGIIESLEHEPVLERSTILSTEACGNPSSFQYIYHSCRKIWFETTVLSVIVSLFGLVLAYYLLDHGAFNDFMNSNTRAPSVVLSGLGLLVTFGLRSIERRERIFETYRRMARRPREAKDCLLLSLGGTPYMGILYGVSHRWYFISLISFTTILADFMQICLSGVPFESGDTLLTYRFSSYLSLSVLALMAMVIMSILWRRRVDPGPPRSPDRLINALLYLCDGNFLPQSTTMSNSRTLRQHYEGRRFEFGETVGPDEKSRWTVNEVKSSTLTPDEFMFENSIPYGKQ